MKVARGRQAAELASRRWAPRALRRATTMRTTDVDDGKNRRCHRRRPTTTEGLGPRVAPTPASGPLIASCGRATTTSRIMPPLRFLLDFNGCRRATSIPRTSFLLQAAATAELLGLAPCSRQRGLMQSLHFASIVRSASVSFNQIYGGSFHMEGRPKIRVATRCYVERVLNAVFCAAASGPALPGI